MPDRQGPENVGVWRARRAVMYRDGSWVCALCGVGIGAKEVEIDHIVPKAEGGSNKMANLRVTCRPCNRQRARDAYTLHRFGEAT